MLRTSRLTPDERRLLERRDGRYAHEAQLIQAVRDAAAERGTSWLARQAGVSKTFVSLVRHGKRRPSTKIGRVFGMERVGGPKKQCLVWRRAFAVRVFLCPGE